MAKRNTCVYSTVDMKDLPTFERSVTQRNPTRTQPPGNVARTNGCIRVLAADDNADIRKLIGLIFTIPAGYTVRFAEDGQDAWRSLCAESFDLLITDIDMPRLGGIELVRRMRQHSFRQPVIFISGILPPDSSGLFELLSPCEKLRKPFSFKELLAKASAMTHRKSPNGTNGSSYSGTNGNSRSV